MTRADASYLSLIAVGLAIDSLVLWPSFLRRLDAEPSRARVWLWSNAIVLLWTLVAAGVALWILERRSWAELRLVAPHGWRVVGTVGLLAAVTIFYGRSVATIRRARRSNRRIRFPTWHGVRPIRVSSSHRGSGCRSQQAFAKSSYFAGT